MGELIDALLSLAQVSRTSLRMDRVSLSMLAERLVSSYRERDPGRDVLVDIEPEIWVQGDQRLLQQVLDNLLGNAWKFTRDATDARIEVGMEPTEAGGAGGGGVARYFVRDNGAGFDPAYIDKLFRPFQRLHSNDIFTGHGIGLASVKRILERHGGEASAEGKPGHGATFRFSLGDPKDDH